MADERNPYASDVVRYFRKKISNGFEGVTYLGAEQRYVAPLRNSSDNNLEEQYLLGTDTYTEVYEDENENIIVEKSFHINSDNSNSVYNDYYKIKTIVYKNAIEDKEFYFDRDTFIENPDEINKLIFGDGSASYPDLNTLYGIDSSIFSFTPTEFEVYPSEFVTVRKDDLYFVTDNGSTETLVLSKTIKKKYVRNNNYIKTVFKEDIKNYLVQ